jgi:hypothetical protein
MSPSPIWRLERGWDRHDTHGGSGMVGDVREMTSDNEILVEEEATSAVTPPGDAADISMWGWQCSMKISSWCSWW